ncbi:MAG: hypothetical protein AAF221_13335 [Pseudomonadota bacterium]
MSGPINTAAKGLIQAEAQLAQAAARLTAPPQAKAGLSFESAQQAFTPKQNAKPDSEGDNKRAPAASPNAKRAVGSAAVTSQGSYLPSLAEETIQMRIAANAYSANARLMDAAEDILKMTQNAFGSTETSDTD